MQYMGGGSLQNLIDARYPVQETAVAIVAYSVLRALEELHSRNIIHRDVKVGEARLTLGHRTLLIIFPHFRPDNSHDY